MSTDPPVLLRSTEVFVRVAGHPERAVGWIVDEPGATITDAQIAGFFRDVADDLAPARRPASSTSGATNPSPRPPRCPRRARRPPHGRPLSLWARRHRAAAVAADQAELVLGVVAGFALLAGDVAVRWREERKRS